MPSNFITRERRFPHIKCTLLTEGKLDQNQPVLTTHSVREANLIGPPVSGKPNVLSHRKNPSNPAAQQQPDQRSLHPRMPAFKASPFNKASPSSNPYAKGSIEGGSDRRAGDSKQLSVGGGSKGEAKDKSNVKPKVTVPFTVKYYNPKFGTRVSEESLQKCPQNTKLQLAKDKSAQKPEREKEATAQKHDNLLDLLKKRDNELNAANLKINGLNEALSNKDNQLDASNRQIRTLKQQIVMLEKHLERSQHELKHLNVELQKLRDLGEEIKKNMSRDVGLKDKRINLMKKERNDLALALKRQLQLTENLRQQNVCLEQSSMLNLEEGEFSKLLEWDMNAVIKS